MNAYATGAVTGGAGANIGGLVGWSDASITNAYATGAVTGGAGASIGGLVGYSTGGARITNAYATGAVTGSAGATVGGLVGWRFGTITASYWNTSTTGRQNGVGSAGGSAGVDLTGLTTTQFQDTAAFMALAQTAGWSFETTWAPPGAGHYPELYALTPVVWISGTEVTSTYGNSTGTKATTVHGGPAAYVFGPSGDSLGLSPQSVSVDPTANAGTTSTAISGAGTLSSAMGQAYRTITFGDNTVTVTQRPLAITADAQSRVYGDANPATGGAAGDDLVNGDTITGVTLTSPATAQNGVGTYDLTGSAATGTGLGNYAITYVTRTGGLTVTARPITVAADNQTMVAGGTEPALTWDVVAGNLVNSDALTGALDRAPGTAAGAYDILQGTLAASTNYNLTYQPGTFTITPASSGGGGGPGGGGTPPEPPMPPEPPTPPEPPPSGGPGGGGTPPIPPPAPGGPGGDPGGGLPPVVPPVPGDSAGGSPPVSPAPPGTNPGADPSNGSPAVLPPLAGEPGRGEGVRLPSDTIVPQDVLLARIASLWAQPNPQTSAQAAVPSFAAPLATASRAPARRAASTATISSECAGASWSGTCASSIPVENRTYGSSLRFRVQ